MILVENTCTMVGLWFWDMCGDGSLAEILELLFVFGLTKCFVVCVLLLGELSLGVPKNAKGKESNTVFILNNVK